ncbi:hypothetical protein P7C71_g3786, partial [Lecanoromycetidae sp. Uapishka_2]
MAPASPTRRALGDLPVNTLGNPTTSMTSNIKTGLKRQIHEVDMAEFGQPAARVRLSSSSLQSTAKDDLLLAQAQSSTLSDPVILVTSAPPESSISRAMETAEESGDADSQNSYKDSMSSLIDFDPDETMASQQTAATEITQPSPTRVRQHAETLRLRLRLAHLKVQTNQTDIPLSRLRLCADDSDDQVFSQDTPDAQQASLPKLLPAPVLLPTAFSARTISRPRIASSPSSPTKDSPKKAEGIETFRTPALPRHTAQTSSRAMSSPLEEKLTSSAVRGKAAIGLLGLRRER